MNYVVMTKDGVGIVVDKKEWSQCVPNLIKTTMTDEQTSSMVNFRKACEDYSKMFR